MNQAEREITCSHNDCLPHGQSAAGTRSSLRAAGFRPAPTGLQLLHTAQTAADVFIRARAIRRTQTRLHLVK